MPYGFSYKAPISGRTSYYIRVYRLKAQLAVSTATRFPTFTLASDFVPQHVDLVHTAELLEHLTKIIFVHGARNLPYEHFDEVRIRLLRTVDASSAAAVVRHVVHGVVHRVTATKPTRKRVTSRSTTCG